MFLESGRVFGEDSLEGKTLGRLTAETAWEDKGQEGALSSLDAAQHWPGAAAHWAQAGQWPVPWSPRWRERVRYSLEGLFKLGSWLEASASLP